MSAENCCQGCGNVLSTGALNGLCPVCLFREGLGNDRLAVETGPFMSGTQGASSELATLDRSIGGLPRVLLRDSDVAAEGPGPLVQPGSPEMPTAAKRTGRLQLLGEIARGGMGAVLKGRDPDLGRDLAVKVLLESHRDKPELIRRFIEEAQIGGQLQHPGYRADLRAGRVRRSSPVFRHEAGQGPYAVEPAGRAIGPGARSCHASLSIFESVCQTIAYAHARGVIHRDLEAVEHHGRLVRRGAGDGLGPGEGVASRRRGRRCVGRKDARARDGDRHGPERWGDSTPTCRRAGSVMGTPSYMAPEQARGEVDRLDERCDVFALGSILCEILTGEPAFIGRSSGEIQRKASRGELKDALDRLDGSDSDVELIELAKDCLASELEDRPRHAGEVAARINAYQTSVQERLRQAEIARAEEKARAEEATKRARVERDRLRLTIALAASVIGLIVLGGGGAFWFVQQRQARLVGCGGDPCPRSSASRSGRCRRGRPRPLARGARRRRPGPRRNRRLGHVRAGQTPGRPPGQDRRRAGARWA